MYELIVVGIQLLDLIGIAILFVMLMSTRGRIKRLEARVSPVESDIDLFRNVFVAHRHVLADIARTANPPSRMTEVAP